MILPKVRWFNQRHGYFELPDPIVIAVGTNASDRTRETARIFADDLSRLVGRAAETRMEPAGHAAIALTVVHGADAESYEIVTSDSGAVITGQGEAGLFYGTRTFLQLIEGDRVPRLEIKDRPDYKHRMVHYDLAREQTCNMDHLKHVIDILSDYKINMLHLYFENRFQFGRHPKVSPPGVMTPDQARELDAYARRRFVELVPEVNCLAHLENALCVEEYTHLAEDPNRPYEICTQNPEAVQFVKDLVAEVAGCFASPHFHMGGDEAWHMGTCPKCRARIEKDGGKHLMFAEHYTEIAEYIKSLGKRPMMWGDMLLNNRGAAERMPKDIIIFDWHYGDTDVKTVRYFTSQGFDTYVCPAMSGFGRLAAPYKHATRNIHKFIGEGVEGGAIGECTCAWELRLGHFFTNDYWGILLSADRSWNIRAGSIADYEPRFCRAFFGLNDLRPIEYYKELSDGYAAVFADAVPPSSWIAFKPMDKEIGEGLGSKITPQILAASDEKLAQLGRMLVDLRSSVRCNADALRFADLPARSAHMMLRRLAFTYQSQQLIEEARRLKESSPDEADSKLREAVALLREVSGDLDYFEHRFQEAVECYGGSREDVRRIEELRQSLDRRIREAEGLMSR